MNQIYYIGSFLLFMLGGIFLGRLLKNIIKKKIIARIQDFFLYAIIFFMGMNVASVDGIIDDLLNIGITAFLFAIFPILGVVILTIIPTIIYILRNEKKERDRTIEIDYTNSTILSKIWNIFKEPFFIIITCIIGGLIYIFTPVKHIYSAKIINYLLYSLMIIVGYTLSTGNFNIAVTIKNPRMILAGITTILGTYLGTIILPVLTTYSFRDCLAATSGFSWYSLSGVLITDLGRPVLGSISFLSNMFREMLSFLLVPIISRLCFHTSVMSVSIAGCTSMDVMLPSLRRAYGDWIIPIGIFNGIVLTFATPILIPFWLG